MPALTPAARRSVRHALIAANILESGENGVFIDAFFAQKIADGIFRLAHRQKYMLGRDVLVLQVCGFLLGPREDLSRRR